MDLDSIEGVSSSDGMDEDEIQHHSLHPHPHHHHSDFPSTKPRNGPTNTNNTIGPTAIAPATRIHELLECPVCTNSMYPPIHQCHNGHTLCSTCILDARSIIAFQLGMAPVYMAFRVVTKNAIKLCLTKTFITVNGQFPGPTQYVREGDTVIVRVTNYAQHNVNIHWHGIKQIRTGWSDGSAHIHKSRQTIFISKLR